MMHGGADWPCYCIECYRKREEEKGDQNMEKVNISAALFNMEDAEKWRLSVLHDFPPGDWGTTLTIANSEVNGRPMYVVSGWRYAEKLRMFKKALHLLGLLK